MSELARHARTTDIDEDSTSETEAEFLREQRESARAFDPELTRLVRFINAADSAEIGLTLHVKGCLVSGLLISAAQYYRLLVKEFTDLDKLSEQSNREVAASFAQSYRPPLDIAEKDVEDSRARKKLPELPCHIHFRQAQTILSGREPFTQSLWRGRLAEVDGWSIGNFGPIPPFGPRVKFVGTAVGLPWRPRPTPRADRIRPRQNPRRVRVGACPRTIR